MLKYRLNTITIQIVLIKYVPTFKYVQADGLFIPSFHKLKKAADPTLD